MQTQHNKELALVRDLARQVAGIAASNENQAVIRRWRDVNAMRTPDRAPVWCKPVKVWLELLPDDSLACEGPVLRRLERNFRQTLIKWDIGDDSPVESFFPVAARFRVEPENTWGVDVVHESSGVDGGAWAYDSPLKTEADFDKLRMPTVAYDKEATVRTVSQMQEILGDALPVRRVCRWPTVGRVNATLGTMAADLRGLSQVMMDLAVEPELMHRLMAHLRDGILSVMDQVEATGLMTPNNTGAMYCSDPIGPAEADATFANSWCAANSQEFDPVSPAMWEEFLLNYQKPIIERFGLSSYGCCENLTQKIDGALSIGNLRIFVCSAWTDLDTVIEKVGSDYTIMWRQKASDVVFPDDASGIRKHMDESLKKLKGCHVQIVLRELQTLAGHPDRLYVWTQIGKEMAAKYA